MIQTFASKETEMIWLGRGIEKIADRHSTGRPKKIENAE